MTDALRVESLERGANIVEQGEDGKKFYIIEDIIVIHTFSELKLTFTLTLLCVPMAW